MNEANFEKSAEQAAAFQKIWMESLSQMMQAACTFTPNSPPPEVMRQMRSGIFQALAQSWEEFMRSPQFQEGMRQWLENAVAFRKMTNNFMANVRNEIQAPSRDDIDSIILTVRHMEKRLLDRMEELALQVSQLQQQLAQAKSVSGRSKRAKPESSSNAAAGEGGAI